MTPEQRDNLKKLADYLAHGVPGWFANHFTESRYLTTIRSFR